MSSNRFNKILIVDSIPTGEENTAQSLYSAISQHAKSHPDSPYPEIVRVESGKEFLDVLSQCVSLARSNGVYSMLHIECHGDEDGFQFADDSLLDWPEMKVPLAELNEAMHLNLMIAVAACVGASIAKVVTMGDRAPFWGMIGPTKDVYPSQLEAPYRALYLTLIETKSAEKSIEAFKRKAGDLYWRTTAQGLFEKGWDLYKRDYCSEPALQKRARRMHARAPQISERECIERLLRHEPSAFEQYRKTFFMCDLFPEHWVRFPVVYEP